MARRPALTREAIVEAAVRVADAKGIAGVSMRNVGAELGVEAMSLYHHVSNKEHLVDVLADWAFNVIALPSLDQSWRTAMTQRAESVRAVLSAHPWALGILESRRQPGPAVIRHHDAVLGCLRRGGFSIALASHAFAVLDAYIYGFVLTEVNLPMEAGESAQEFAAEIGLSAEEYPYLVEMITDQVVGDHYDYGNEFGYGLDLILDGLAAQLESSDR